MSNDVSIVSKEGWLKIKLHTQSKWHRRFCIIDWDKAVLFIASKSDTRYRDWIKLLPNILVNDNYEHFYGIDSLNTTTNSPIVPTNTIEIRADNGTSIHLLQAESKKEFDSWLLALRRTTFSRIGGGIFGQSIDDTFRYSRDKTSLVPVIIRQCCEHLLEHGLTFVGLFRVPGKQSAIKELRDLYDRGCLVELTSAHSPATISSLLKIYLQSLPEPIIPDQYFDDYFEIGSRLKYNQTSDINRLKQLIHTSLTNTNYKILSYLCLFLKKITDHANETKMDTENLSVVFGNNLIRPPDELDLNMIKGHNYNLLPLIKVLIDQSEYLFSTGGQSSNESNNEQHNESTTKSSGFSSFSSLLSSTDQHLSTTVRSLSLPSICAATFSSNDSAHSSADDQPSVKLRSATSTSTHSKVMLIKDRISTQQSFTTCLEPSFQSIEDSDTYELEVHSVMDLLDERNQSEEPKKLQKKFASADPLLPTSATVEESPAVEKRLVETSSDIPVRPVSTIGVESSSVRKATKVPSKKSLANKFGKSISSFKSSMSKALQTHAPVANEVHTQAQRSSLPPMIDLPSPKTTASIYATTNRKRSGGKSFYDDLQQTDVEKLQAEISSFKELLDAKELLLIELTTNSRRERLRYEKEKQELQIEIDRLKIENFNLQIELKSFTKLESIC